MGLILSLIVGGVLGWGAGFIMRGNPARGPFLNIMIGMLGALLGAFFLGPLLGGGNLLDAEIDPMTAVVSAIGAAILLGALHLLRSRRGR